MSSDRRPARRARARHAPASSRIPRLAAVGLLLVAAAIAGGGLALHGGDGEEPKPAAGSSSLAPGPVGDQGAPASAGTGDEPVGLALPSQAGQGVVQSGPGTFGYAAASTAVAGGAGTLRRYQVAVENGIGQDPAAFATAVGTILGDQRSWIAGNDVRFQRVGADATADFAILLATPATSTAICATAGLHTRQYTSCRVPGKVVINLARWLTAVPNYGADVEVYRAYAVNHEIGHELGHGHEGCPASGRAAPVMLQQTLGLRGCTANAWPYLDGKRYSGPAIP